MGKIAAIVPAAGYSSRMGLFKPLLTLEDSLVIEKPISALLEAGIHDIYVVIGHHAHLLKPVIERLGARWVENIHYDQGMYSSIQEGVRALPKETEAFFLLPADTPLVSADTIKQLLTLYNQKPCDVIFPVYDGQRGHPPLISTKLRPAILQNEVKGGLKVLLNEATNIKEAITGDVGILKDLDTEEDYRRMLPSALAHYPTRQECEQILRDSEVSQQVLLHSRQVAKLAARIAIHLNSQGLRLHLGLLQAACLLHDIAKGEMGHANKGKELLEALGFSEVASVIGAHMDLPEKHTQQMNEYSLLYLADKMVKGTEFIDPEQRKAEKMDYFQNNPAAQQAVQKRMDSAIYLRDKIERRIGTSIATIAGEL